MNSSIKKFILPLEEKGDEYYTHISQIQPTGKYNICRKNIESFWDLYCDTLSVDDNMISGIGERPMDYIPVLNDTDIKVEYDRTVHSLDKKLYLDSQVMDIISIYQKHLKLIIKDYLPKHGICFLLEKQRPRIDDKNMISHGFHLHFIYTLMNKVDQDVHFIPRIRKEVEEKQVFKNLGISNSADVIDKSCTSKFWLLYGSRKKENLQSYRVTRIFDDRCNEITLAEALREFTLKNVHGDVLEIKKPLEYYLPRILSINPANRENVYVRTDLQILSKKIMKKAKDSKKIYEDMPVTECLKKAKDLLKLISPVRADVYEDWIDIGWILFNIGDGTEEALDMWIEFSSRTSKQGYFSEKTCVYEWGMMEKRNKGIGSLYFYAKTDSPEEYKLIQKRENDRLFNESLNGGHYDMAKWLHNKYRDEFVCACIEKDVWFRFSNHKWELNTKGLDIRKKISTELVSQYKILKKKICEEMGEEEDDSECQKKLKTVNKIISNLKCSPFKNNIMKECIVEGTRVTMSDFTFKEIQDINSGDLVFSMGKDKTLYSDIVNGKKFMGEKECVRITTEMGLVLECTLDHLILREDMNWVESRHLSIDDSIVASIDSYLHRGNLISRISGFMYRNTSNTIGFKNIDDCRNFMKDIIQVYPHCNADMSYNYSENKFMLNINSLSSIVLDTTSMDKDYVCGIFSSYGYITHDGLLCIDYVYIFGCSSNVKSILSTLKIEHFVLVQDGRLTLIVTDILDFYKKIGICYDKLKTIKIHCILYKKDIMYLSDDEINTDGVPYFKQRIKSIERVGVKRVYDISVTYNHNFIANGVVVHNCQELFYQNGFANKLDINSYLLHFENGVLDLKEKRLREGRPSDYLSLSTGYSFVEHKWDDLEVMEVEDHISKVFPDPLLKQYFIEYCANLLVGGNNIKTFLNMSGEGDNGKSINMDLLKLVLGKYMKIFPTSLITGKRTQSSQATPELNGLPGVRFAVIQEPNSKDVLNVGFLKELSGNDVIYVRGLYKDSQEVRPQFKLALICNHLPSLPCFTGDTVVSLSCGMGVKISNMGSVRDILSWDSEKIGLINTSHNSLLDQGIKSCIQLTFIDGRNITCTPDHRFLSTTGEWVEAKDIILGSTEIETGYDVPRCDDIFDEYSYVFNINNVVYDMSVFNDKIKLMALFRLIGGLTILENKYLHSDYRIDCRSIADDVYTVTGIKYGIINDSCGFLLDINSSPFNKTLAYIEDTMSLLNFLDTSTPLFLLREFLASFFNKHLSSMFIKRDECGTLTIDSIVFSTFIGGEDRDEYIDTYTRINNILNSLFSIESRVYTTEEDNQGTVCLCIDREDDILKFGESIGFRYGFISSYRLSIVCSFIRYKKHIDSINSRIRNSVSHSYAENMDIYRIYSSYEKSISEINDEYGGIDYETIVSFIQVYKYIIRGEECKNTIDLNSFLYITDSLRYFTREDACTHFDRESLPTTRMFVTGIKSVGEKRVYDLTVDSPYSSFVANGAVVHNCDDPAAWNRIRVLPHESCFPKDKSTVPETIEEQIKVKRFPRDPFFSEKLPKMKTAFMWIMWENYKRIEKYGRMPEPEKVREATSIYRKNNDVFLQFIDERIIEDQENDKAVLSIVETYNAFKTWFNDSYPNLHFQIPSKEDMKSNLIKKWGELTKGYKWRGFRLRTPEDDEKDGNAIILRDDDLLSPPDKKKDKKGKDCNKEEVDVEEDIDDDENSDSNDEVDSDEEEVDSEIEVD